MTLYPSDTSWTRIEYPSADLYNTYTIYNTADVRSDVLNDTMSSYYLHNHRIFGLNRISKQQLQWLEAKYPSYLEAQARGRYDQYWPKFFQDWFEEFPAPEPPVSSKRKRSRTKSKPNKKRVS
jgi:hypothetical protein